MYDFQNEFYDLPMVLNIEDIQRILNVSRHGVLKLFASKDFPALEIMQRKLVLKSSFIEWLDMQKEAQHNGNKTTR